MALFPPFIPSLLPSLPPTLLPSLLPSLLQCTFTKPIFLLPFLLLATVLHSSILLLPYTFTCPLFSLSPHSKQPSSLLLQPHPNLSFFHTFLSFKTPYREILTLSYLLHSLPLPPSLSSSLTSLPPFLPTLYTSFLLAFRTLRWVWSAGEICKSSLRGEKKVTSKGSRMKLRKGIGSSFLLGSIHFYL